MFPLLEFVDEILIKEHSYYTTESVASARLELLKPTNMVDYAAEINQQLTGATSMPAEFAAQKEKVLSTLSSLTEEAAPFSALAADADQRADLESKGLWTMAGLAEAGVTPAIVEAYRSLSKFHYDCGDYQNTLNMLDNYLSLFIKRPETGKDERREDASLAAYGITTLTRATHAALWGKLACLILLGEWDRSLVALNAVKYGIETRACEPGEEGLSALQALQQRTWLLHWGLFVFWNNSKKGLDLIIDLSMSEKYMQAIQTNAPHLLRYLASAIVINKRKRNHLKDLVKIIGHCDYEDPVIAFVDCLAVKFDFEAAQEKLAECERVLATDFFLCRQTSLFMEEARVFIFENYCRIHQKIGIEALSEKLAMPADEAERWIVDLIRNAFLDAKIDSNESCVVMGNTTPSVYQQVMAKTKDLTARSGNLATTLGQIVGEAKKDKAKRAREARGD